MSQVWFVTGSSRGLGLSTVEKALAAGHTVVATARKPACEPLNKLKEKYGSDKFLPLALDVTDSAQVDEVVNKTKKTFSRIDFVVNNAGFADIASIEDAAPEAFRGQVEVNLFGVINVTKAVLPILREQGSGHIFQVSTVGGRVGTPGLAAYQTSKWGVTGFSTVLAQEVAPFGIKITVLEIGGMKTEWADLALAGSPPSQPYEQTVGQFKPFLKSLEGGWTEPDRVAELMLHLAALESPPLRLLVGADALQWAKRAGDQLAASDDEWKELSEMKF